jgi:recombination protein RecR
MRLAEELAKLPGLGEKSAERLAFHIFRMPESERNSLVQGILAVKNIRHCPTCFSLITNHTQTESETLLCAICTDSQRDKSVLCVVETYDDLWGIEKTGAYNGLYHTLLGRIAPLENCGPDNLTINKFIARLKADSNIKEIILATNPTLEGDNTALYLQQQIAALATPQSQIKITRLARGIPTGSTIGYANKITLSESLKGRQECRK